MFKGFTENLKNRFEKINCQSDKFTFSFADLELVEKNDKWRKCRIISDEASKKAHRIYSQEKSGYVPEIKFIEFELDDFSENFLLFPSWNDNYLCNYSWWLSLNKKDLQEKSEVFSNGTSKLNFLPLVDCGRNIFMIRSSYPKEYEELSNRYENDYINQKTSETESTRSSALQTIENTIKNGNIDETTLKDAGLFLEESYVSARPDDCLHCNDPEELAPDKEAEYYETHINKCIWRPDRINEFKDKQIDLIERIINKFNDYKNDVIKQIIKKAQKQGISEEELKNNRPDWQNTLRSLTNREKIAEYQTDQLEEDIKKLVEAKNKSAEEREQAKQQELNQKREEFISQITTALNQEPQLTNSELSPEYQNWEAQINQIADIQQITNFQDRLLADIQARQHDKKTAQKVKENLNKARTGTPEQKEQAFKDLEEQETQKGYQENKAEAEELKKEKAAINLQEYSEEAKQKIEKKLKNNEVKESELNNENQQEIQKLKNNEIKDPTKLVEKEIENLLTQLENHSTLNNEHNTSKPENFPWKVVIPFLVIGLSIMLVIPLVRKRIKVKKRIG